MNKSKLKKVFSIFLFVPFFSTNANTLDFYLNEAAVARTPAPYTKYKEYSQKKQILLSECMRLHGMKAITSFRIADNLEKNLDKVADATLYVEHTNRFNEKMIKTYECVWTTQNYIIKPLEEKQLPN